jgi:methylenetetrahydrofolate dehydrogenase (NADP+)/methenyltetrahydrofolate cyclohydrolase
MTMTQQARRLSGKPVREAVLTEVRRGIAELGRQPGLVVLRVGDDPASVSYTTSKAKTAAELGMKSDLRVLPESASQDQVLAEIARLNADRAVDSYLVQLPLPDQIDEESVLLAIDPDKDADGLHPMNVGRLWTKRPGPVPCTPAGVIRLLDHYQIPLRGAHAVIVNRSQLVGTPLVRLMLNRDATVTVAHTKTRDIPALTRQADIVVTAAGRAGLLTAEMISPGATVIDVGITRTADGRLAGDVAAEVWDVAGAVTPMPGGTGPMTVAMLMWNALEAARARRLD